MAVNPYELPSGLPVPRDDGACDHLPGMVVPPVRLPSTRGHAVDLEEAARRPLVVFFYPATGQPGEPTPREWDLIPGARGCTPQNCVYRDRYQEFQDLGFEVHAVSGQQPDAQWEFAERMHIPFLLLSDSAFELTEAMRLPTFQFGGRRFIKRLTLVVGDGRVKKVFYPVFPPDRDAEVVLRYLRTP